MTDVVDVALGRLRDRAAVDPEFADAVVWMADDVVDDPFASPPDAVVGLARSVNRRRQSARDHDFRHGAYTTREVVELLASVNDRKGVDRRRRRNTLLGIRSGADTLHPAWQFDRRRREVWPGLSDVLEALRSVAADGVDVDAIATAEGASVDGRSIAQLLADGEVDAAVRAAHLAGDQS